MCYFKINFTPEVELQNLADILKAFCVGNRDRRTTVCIGAKNKVKQTFLKF